MDIEALYRCPNSQIFQVASNLFEEKWSSVKDAKVQDFVRYFQSNWLMKNNLWYLGAATGYPLPNNGLEATNSTIKREHTLRQRLPVGQFLRKVQQLVGKWSKDRNPSCGIERLSEEIRNLAEFR